jgi:CheY-like chemotaxis protein
MISGSNHSSGGPTAGSNGQKRRHGRRPQGTQQSSGSNGQNPRRPRRNATQTAGQNKPRGPRQASPRVSSAANPRTPDAGIYSAPMDHNYRLQADGNHRSGSEAEPMAIAADAPARSILAFVDDLFFVAKIQETARKLNIKVEFAKPVKETLEEIVAREEKPSLIIYDLNAMSSKPLTVIPKLKAKLKKATSIIGFLSHIQGELKVAAAEAGCDMVLPRSAFSQNLPQLLRRHATPDLGDCEEETGL